MGRNTIYVIILARLILFLWGGANTANAQKILVFSSPPFEKRVEYLQNRLSSNPDDLESHIELGKLFLSEGMLDKAIAEFEYVLSIDSLNVEAYVLLSEALQSRPNADLRNAVRLLKKAIQLAPDYAMAHLNLAHLYITVKEENKALNEFTKVIKLSSHPDYLLAAHLGRRDIYLEQKEIKKANYEFEQARRIDPMVVELIKKAESIRNTASETKAPDPATINRKNLIAVEGGLGLHYGALLDYYSGVRLFGESERLVLSLPITAILLLYNRLQISLTAPLLLQGGLIQAPSFPLRQKDVIGFMGGVGNITVSASLSLFDNIKPPLTIGTIVVTPWKIKLFEEYTDPMPDQLHLSFGSRLWRRFYTLNLEIPVHNNLHLIGQSYYSKGRDKNQRGDVIDIGGGINIPINPNWGWRISSLGFLYEHLIPLDNDSTVDNPVERRFSFFNQTQHEHGGLLTFFIGMHLIGEGDDQIREFYLSAFSSSLLRFFWKRF